MAAMVTASDIFGTQNKKECRIVTQQAACKFTGRLFKWQSKAHGIKWFVLLAGVLSAQNL